MDNIIRCFEAYLMQYDFNDPKMSLKKEHSYRVMELNGALATSLNLSEEDILLAKVVGLLHDIGRFEQLKQVKTHDDSKFEHGDYGAKYLKESDFLSKLSIPKKWYSIIITCTREHNKHTICDGLDERTLLHVKMIRDVDKIDIFRVVMNRPIKNDGLGLTPEVIKQFYEKKSISIPTTKSNLDFVLVRLSFFFDMNFLYTYQKIKEERLIEQYYLNMTEKELLKPYFELIQEYLNMKIEEENRC